MRLHFISGYIAANNKVVISQTSWVFCEIRNKITYYATRTTTDYFCQVELSPVALFSPRDHLDATRASGTVADRD